MENIKLSHSGQYTYFDDKKPWVEKGSISPSSKNYLLKAQMNLKELFDSTSSPGHYYYHTERASSFNPDLLNKLRYLFDLKVSPFDSPADLNIWISSWNTTAGFHYDEQNNLFLQLYGRKRFVLFEHQDFDEIYPSLHPMARQVFTDISWSAELTEWARRENTSNPPQWLYGKRVHVIDLLPGDLLYLPPFYYHMVIATSPVSISANLWSYTSDENVRKELERVSLPKFFLTAKERKTPEAVLGLVHLILLLEDGFHSQCTAAKDGLNSSRTLGGREADGSCLSQLCSILQVNQGRLQNLKEDADNGSTSSQKNVAFICPQSSTDFLTSAPLKNEIESVSRKILKISTRFSNPLATRIFLADFIESLIDIFLGHLSSVDSVLVVMKCVEEHNQGRGKIVAKKTPPRSPASCLLE